MVDAVKTNLAAALACDQNARDAVAHMRRRVEQMQGYLAQAEGLAAEAAELLERRKREARDAGVEVNDAARG